MRWTRAIGCSERRRGARRRPGRIGGGGPVTGSTPGPSIGSSASGRRSRRASSAAPRPRLLASIRDRSSRRLSSVSCRTSASIRSTTRRASWIGRGRRPMTSAARSSPRPTRRRPSLAAREARPAPSAARRAERPATSARPPTRSGSPGRVVNASPTEAGSLASSSAVAASTWRDEPRRSTARAAVATAIHPTRRPTRRQIARTARRLNRSAPRWSPERPPIRLRPGGVPGVADRTARPGRPGWCPRRRPGPG